MVSDEIQIEFYNTVISSMNDMLHLMVSLTQAFTQMETMRAEALPKTEKLRIDEFSKMYNLISETNDKLDSISDSLANLNAKINSIEAVTHKT